MLGWFHGVKSCSEVLFNLKSTVTLKNTQGKQYGTILTHNRLDIRA